MKNKSKKIKVLLVTEYFPPKIFGGGEISAYLLAKNLAKKGIDVSVLTSSSKGLPEREEKEGFIIIRNLSTGKNPNNLFSNIKRMLFFRYSVKKQISNLEKTESFDVIHFLNTTSITKINTRTKKVATINGYTQFCPKSNLFYKEKSECTGCNPVKFLGCIVNSEYIGKNRMNFLLRYNPLFWLAIYSSYVRRRNNLKSVDRFISISDFVTELLVSHGVPRQKIAKVYNIADIKDNDLEVKEIKNKIKNKKIITYMGALEKIKGVDMAIKAFSRAGSRDAFLMIVGDGSEKKKLEKLSSELGIGNRVIFAGSVEQKYIPFIYKNSELILQTSLFPEPFSRIVMEAAYFKVPLLAMARGGNRDLPEKYLFSDEKEFAQKIDSFLSKKQKPIDFRIFEPEKNINKIISLYLSVNS